jgi:hypothetical protein
LTTPPPLLSIEDIEKAMSELRMLFQQLSHKHQALMSDHRNWLLAMRCLETVQVHINGATYTPPEET